MGVVAVVGDYDPSAETHTTIKESIDHSDSHFGWGRTEVEWLGTLACERMAPEELATFDAVWIAPGSPYRSMDGALRAIHHARTQDIPLLGTCGGFQHMVLEFARNVMGISDAAHAEYDPLGSQLFISNLACSLVGTTMKVELLSGTRAGAMYGTAVAEEKYYCRFGLNLDYLDQLMSHGMVVSGTGSNGEPRIVELPHLRHYLATLFVPQTSSTPSHPHPLVTGLLRAARGSVAGSAHPSALILRSGTRREGGSCWPR